MRFNGWTQGELFVTSDKLIPNARRDDFEQNESYFKLIEVLQEGIGTEITKAIREASSLRNDTSAKVINEVQKQVNDATVIVTEGFNSSVDKLRFPVNVLYIFPAIARNDVNEAGDKELQKFTKEHYLFKEDLQRVRTELAGLEKVCFSNSIVDVSSERFEINNDNVNPILHRIAPEYVTIRVSTIADTETKAGVDDELLVIIK